MPIAYTAQIRKLRLPEQDGLKNESERCSADPLMLASIGRSLGEQVRIQRSDRSGFVALYTVKEAKPAAEASDPARASIVRTGQGGRERLGSGEEMAAIVQATVLDAPPQAGEPVGVRFFEAAKDEGGRGYFIAIAPHGGEIERDTAEQATCAFDALVSANFPASLWLCRGTGDQPKGAFDRWHITSTDLQPACFPLLQPFAARRFCYGVAFHGFQRKDGEADVYIGGRAPRPLKLAIERELNGLDLPIRVRISTDDDDPKFQGFSRENLINRLAASGIHLEQSVEARKEFHGDITRAVAAVFASRRRFLPCQFMRDLERQRADAEAVLARSLSKSLAAGRLNMNRAIAQHKAWRTKDDALAAKIKACEELRTFIDERTEALETTPRKAASPTHSPGSRKPARRGK